MHNPPKGIKIIQNILQVHFGNDESEEGRPGDEDTCRSFQLPHDSSLEGFSGPWEKRRRSPRVRSENWRKAWYRRACSGNPKPKELLSADHGELRGEAFFPQP